MRIEARKKDNIIILDLDGPLTSGVGDVMLREAMNAYVAEGWQNILLNLAEVSRIDSTGIGELVASIKLANRFGSKVKLVNIDTKVRHVLDLSRILPLLDFHESEEKALEEFAAEASGAQES